MIDIHFPFHPAGLEMCWTWDAEQGTAKTMTSDRSVTYVDIVANEIGRPAAGIMDSRTSEEAWQRAVELLTEMTAEL